MNLFSRFNENRPRNRNRQADRRERKKLKRRLRAETLEPRQLLAADTDALRHNVFDAEDVNNDGVVSSIDALMVINAMSRDGTADTDAFTDVNNDGRRTSLDALMIINRLSRRGRQGTPQPPAPEQSVPAAADEIRSIDGTGNNLENPELGSPGQQLLRIADADYADEISAPAGEDRPSAREISNLLSSATEDGTFNDRQLSSFLFLWGQFIDHDIDLTHASEDDPEAFDIAVPQGDPLFDPFGTGEVTIPLTRSEYDPETGVSTDSPRQQVNSITAFIDGSMVYGSDQATADRVRSFQGGRLLITDDGLLPTDEDSNVIAGDVRAAENISLTAMHALFVREHNRLADLIAEQNPELTDEQIYQQARAVVTAEIQAITYNEFLPALLGNRTISEYRGYDSSIDPAIANEFSTAAFRFGHSTVNDEIQFYDNDGRPVSDPIDLAEAFFNPSLLQQTGIDSILKYVASSQSQEIDLEVVDSLRNFLFGPPGAGGLDLVSLNIQRGRDHGLADYNATRVAYGLPSVESFDQITSDVELQEKLKTLYGDVNNIDLWVGLLAEDHVRGASVGILAQTIIADQFQRLRDGDRFWYQNIFDGQDLRQLESTTLADVIERNTNIEGLQDNVFFMRASVSGTVVNATAETIVDNNRGGRGRLNRSPTSGVSGVALELLDAEGELIDTAVTDSRGNYRFSSIPQTGDYQIRLAESTDGLSQTLDVLIPNGSTRIRGLDLRLNV